jgi:hypothetical protein
MHKSKNCLLENEKNSVNRRYFDIFSSESDNILSFLLSCLIFYHLMYLIELLQRLWFYYCVLAACFYNSAEAIPSFTASNHYKIGTELQPKTQI